MDVDPCAYPGMKGVPHRPLRLLPGVDLRGELEALAKGDPWLCGFIVCGIGGIGSHKSCLASLIKPRPWDGAHLHMVRGRHRRAHAWR